MSYKMGIPGFYGFLKRTGRGNFRLTAPSRVGILAIDMNSLIHRSAQTVFEYGDGGQGIPPTPLTKEQYTVRLAELFKHIWNEIVKMVSTVKPSEQLILAVDGVAPQAKIARQRKGRYASAKNRAENQSFDSNQITPGTMFMHLLDTYLLKMLRETQSNMQLRALFPPLIKYSSYRHPGEGEHKIADILRLFVQRRNKLPSLVIDGLDADLFMIYLPLVPCFESIHLRRGEKEYYYLSAHNYRDPFDVVVKSFFIGNDFLPRFPGFSQVDNLLSDIFFNEPTENTIIVKGDFFASQLIPATINWSNLRTWLTSIQGRYMKDLQAWGLTAGGYVSSALTILQHHGSEKARQEVSWNQSVFREVWYEHAHAPSRTNSRNNSSEVKSLTITATDIQAMIRSYLKGVEWVFKYYSLGYSKVNALWYYPYHYAPAFEDLIGYLFDKGAAAIAIETATLANATPLTMEEQLVMVMPPRSIQFVPLHLQPLFSERSPIADYFPSDFKFDSVGFPPQHEYEFIPLIPIVYPYRLRAAVEMMPKPRKALPELEQKVAGATEDFIMTG